MLVYVLPFLQLFGFYLYIVLYEISVNAKVWATISSDVAPKELFVDNIAKLITIANSTVRK